MTFFIRFALVLAGVAALIGVWFGLKIMVANIWPWTERGFTSDSGVIAAAILFVLVVAAVFTGLSMSEGDSGRCGPGTRRIVERVWTGKVYATDYVCVVDPG